MFQQIIKQWFWDCYDHLGRLVFANLLAFVVLGGSLFLVLGFIAGVLETLEPVQAIVVLLFSLLVTMPPWMAIWFSFYAQFAALVSDEKDPPARAFFSGILSHGFRFWKFFQIYMVALAILAGNIWFYFFSGMIPPSWHLAGYGLGGICFWLALIVILSMLPGIALVGRQDRSIPATIRLSLGILAHRPGLTIGLAVFLLSMWVLGAAMRLVGIIGFAFSGTAMLINSFYDVLLDAEEKAAKEREESKPTSWKEVRAAEDAEDEDRIRKARYERTFRDIIRPWEDS